MEENGESPGLSLIIATPVSELGLEGGQKGWEGPQLPFYTLAPDECAVSPAPWLA